MKRPLLKILSLTLILSATITFTLIAIAPPQKTSRLPLSRFGLTGELVYIVTHLDPSLDQPDLRLGDIIRATSVDGQIRDVEKFQKGVRATAPNTAIQATILRVNPSTGSFEERQTSLKTLPLPNRPSLSRLSVIGQVGFMIKEIDPSVGQLGLKMGDIISATSLGGQITNVEKFQKDVRASAQYSAIQATILRFNSLTGSFEERQTSLRTVPFPSAPKKQKSHLSSQQEDDSCDVPCWWCCERCIGNPSLESSVECALSACETGLKNCKIKDGKCEFGFCV
jgi:hypothetical protein